MAWVDIDNVGAIGVNADIGQNKLPLNAWTNANNIRFLSGSIYQAYGYGKAFGNPEIVPYHLLPVEVENNEYWIYAGLNKIYGVTITDGMPVHTNLTRQEIAEDALDSEGEYPDNDYSAKPNTWTSCVLNGSPILNAGNDIDYPQVWSKEAGDRFMDLPNWPENTYCQSLRVFKNHLIALNVTLPLTGGLTVTITGQAGNIFTGTISSNSNAAISGTFSGTITAPETVTKTDTGTLSGTIAKSDDGVSDGVITGSITGKITATFTGTIDGTMSGTLSGSISGIEDGKITGSVSGTYSEMRATHIPNLVKWSHPASMGFVPESWAIDDPAVDSGEKPLSEDDGEIVDGLTLGDHFIIYKKSSIWVMSYVGGNQIFSFQRVLGSVGAMNQNCVAEHEGYHFVFGESDIFIHNGYEPKSILDNVIRRQLFQQMIDVENRHKCFVFKNPFFNEVYACFPEVGSESVSRALVWNYVDQTVSIRDIPSLNHANYGAINTQWGGTWDSMNDPWNAVLFSWNSSAFSPSKNRVLMASEEKQIFLLDASASYDGKLPKSFIERCGMSLGDPREIMMLRGVRLIGTGNTDETVTVRVGSQDNPFSAAQWSDPVPYVIGHTIQCDLIKKGRFFALRIDSGSAYQWRIDKIMIDIVSAGKW